MSNYTVIIGGEGPPIPNSLMTTIGFKTLEMALLCAYAISRNDEEIVVYVEDYNGKKYTYRCLLRPLA